MLAINNLNSIKVLVRDIGLDAMSRYWWIIHGYRVIEIQQNNTTGNYQPTITASLSR